MPMSDSIRMLALMVLLLDLELKIYNSRVVSASIETGRYSLVPRSIN